ncbi:MAG TPA: hypothetical protein PLJ35_09160 [Anaerolineae bacterium]|nr:hypothetical protein [Anaerolineae bacterium]HPL28896.1 hypothetical protein [Anaerolineae bacterium]
MLVEHDGKRPTAKATEHSPQKAKKASAASDFVRAHKDSILTVLPLWSHRSKTDKVDMNGVFAHLKVGVPMVGAGLICFRSCHRATSPGDINANTLPMSASKPSVLYSAARLVPL